MGLEVARVDENAVIDHVLMAVAAGEGGWICPVNLDVLRQVVRDPTRRSLVAQADVVVADGMPLIWASRVQQTPIPERVSGSSLVRTLPAAGRALGTSIFLLGGAPGVAEAAAEELRRSVAGVNIAGTLCPPVGFERSPAQLKAIEATLAQADPDVVFVGLGFPKQDQLIAQLRTRFPRTWFVSCGISLSYLSGDVVRAPEWIQQLGLEWLHRLVQEPRRLARRYLVQGFPFFARLLMSAVRTRVSAA
jgi:N-acetylglucosaminyldiphosphoundecaprenol N-acetyl-beta-D-mannosaminyltransferase